MLRRIEVLLIWDVSDTIDWEEDDGEEMDENMLPRTAFEEVSKAILEGLGGSSDWEVAVCRL